METKDVVQRFYDGLARKDSSWQDNLTEGVAFSDASGKLTAQGREAFIQSFSGFLRAVEKVQLIVEGPNAAAVVSYDYVRPGGTARGYRRRERRDPPIADGRFAGRCPPCGAAWCRPAEFGSQ